MSSGNYAPNATAPSSWFTGKPRYPREQWRLSTSHKKNGRTSTDQEEHDEIDRILSEQEAEAREQAIRLKRIEIELGIFKRDPEIIANQQ